VRLRISFWKGGGGMVGLSPASPGGGNKNNSIGSYTTNCFATPTAGPGCPTFEKGAVAYLLFGRVAAG